MCIDLNNWTPRYQIDMCYNGIRLLAPNLDILLSSIHNIIGEGLCNHFKRKIICTLSSSNFCSQLWFQHLIWKCAWFAIANPMRWFSSHQMVKYFHGVGGANKREPNTSRIKKTRITYKLWSIVMDKTRLRGIKNKVTSTTAKWNLVELQKANTLVNFQKIFYETRAIGGKAPSQYGSR